MRGGSCSSSSGMKQFNDVDDIETKHNTKKKNFSTFHFIFFSKFFFQENDDVTINTLFSFFCKKKTFYICVCFFCIKKKICAISAESHEFLLRIFFALFLLFFLILFLNYCYVNITNPLWFVWGLIHSHSFFFFFCFLQPKDE